MAARRELFASSVAGALAQIQLNLASVEQFASIACGLADDNPSIRVGVHEGAQAILRAGQLVDHLRSLFAHQHAIEREQRPDHASLCFGGVGVCVGADQEAGSLRHFTWANQLTLVRASKSLVANVAKILYLTQEIAVVSQRGRRSTLADHPAASRRLPSPSSNANRENANDKGGNEIDNLHDDDDEQTLSDRLDNVANYSQLLRSFGKLSVDLVDLGACIMWARKLRHQQRRQQQQQKRGRKTRQMLAVSSSHVNYSSELAQKQAVSVFPPVSLARGRGSVPKSPPPPPSAPIRPSSSMLFSNSSTIYQQPADYMTAKRATYLAAHHAHHNYASHAPNSSTASGSPRVFAAGGQELSSQWLPPDEFEQLASVGGGGVGGQLYSTYNKSTNKDSNCLPFERRLEARIQDMQILFQVNRLIIERSILLLLSASKCCLTGERSLANFGLEARRSIGVQIRVSISIIMALVKCSVFGARRRSLGPGGPAGSCSNSSSSDQEHLLNDDDHQLRSAESAIDEIFMSEQQQQQQQKQNCNTENVNLETDNNGGKQRLPLAVLNINSTCESPTFGYLRPSSMNEVKQRLRNSNEPNDELLQIGRLFAVDDERASLWPPPSAEFNQRQRQRPTLNASATSTTSRLTGGQFDIMNYFLLTPNGTLSAHDAIYGLQSLVEPFKRVANQDELAGELDQALELARTTLSLRVAGKTPAQAQTMSTGAPESQARQQEADLLEELPPVVLMNKRQLVRALNLIFLGQLKANLVERLHEFTDCAYTKHESRETIVALLACVKLQLNKFVRLIYRLRRRSGSLNEPSQLAHLRQVAAQLEDTCAELDYELKTISVEQSDELDRTNSELELVKQLKHLCLVGDATKVRLICAQFSDQSDQLIETCKMLNQIAPTNKLKISTKVLASWFAANAGQFVRAAHALAGSPRSRELKDCAWAYMQTWSSFYDDFCQLARQIAYLVHSSSIDHEQQLQFRSMSQSQRRARIIARRQEEEEQMNTCRRLSSCATSGEDVLLLAADYISQDGSGNSNNNNNNNKSSERYLMSCALEGDLSVVSGPNANENIACHQLLTTNAPADDYQHDNPFGVVNGQQQQRQFAAAAAVGSDSPRSLDHYHGFGPNYRRSHEHSCAPMLPAAAVATEYTSLIPFSAQLAEGRHSSAAAFVPSASTSSSTSSSGRHNQQQQQRLMGTQPTTRGSNYFVVLDDDDNNNNNNDDNDENEHHQHVDNELQRCPRRVSACTPPPPPPVDCLDCQVMAADNYTPVLRPRPPPPLPPLMQQQQQQQQQYLHQNSWSSDTQPPRRPPPPPPPPPPLATFDEQPPQIQHQQRSRSRLRNQTDELAVVDEDPSTSGLAKPTGLSLEQQSNSQPVQQQQQPPQPTPVDQVDKWSDLEADAIVRGARETAQMALSMYQFTRGEGDLNTTQDLFTQAELFAEEANELYKEVRCFSYKVPAGDLKKELLFQLSTIPALVQQLQFTVKNPTVGKAATFAKVDSVIRETKSLMEAVNRVVEATLSCRQHYNMATASLRKRTRTLSPSYRADKGGFEFDSISSLGGAAGQRQQSLSGSIRHTSGSMGSEPDI